MIWSAGRKDQHSDFISRMIWRLMLQILKGLFTGCDGQVRYGLASFDNRAFLNASTALDPTRFQPTTIFDIGIVRSTSRHATSGGNDSRKSRQVRLRLKRFVRLLAFFEGQRLVRIEWAFLGYGFSIRPSDFDRRDFLFFSKPEIQRIKTVRNVT